MGSNFYHKIATFSCDVFDVIILFASHFYRPSNLLYGTNMT